MSLFEDIFYCFNASDTKISSAMPLKKIEQNELLLPEHPSPPQIQSNLILDKFCNMQEMLHQIQLRQKTNSVSYAFFFRFEVGPEL